MKWIKTIDDLTNHIFRNKEIKAKGNAQRQIAVKPRIIFDDACLKIADELTTIGFDYFSSQHKLKIENIDRSYSLIIKFSSSRDNVAGEYVEFSVVFIINSKKLKQFSKSNPILNYWNDTLIIRDLGNLIKDDAGGLIWNLADERDYQYAINIIPSVVKEALMPIFDSFQNPEWIISEIDQGDFELINPISTVQYLLLHDRQDVAERYLTNFLNRKPDKILEDYNASVEKLNSNGMPKEFVHGMGFGYEIALLEKAYGLKISIP